MSNDYTERSPGEWDPDELLTEDAQRDPYQWFAEMREKGPVRYDDERNAYDVFGYDETVEMLTDWEDSPGTKPRLLEGR